jgi:hypothetical protein
VHAQPGTKSDGVATGKPHRHQYPNERADLLDLKQNVVPPCPPLSILLRNVQNRVRQPEAQMAIVLLEWPSAHRAAPLLHGFSMAVTGACRRA